MTKPPATIESILKIYRCTDRDCVFGHPGGMGTNGGCETMKLPVHELRLILRSLVRDFRELQNRQKEQVS